MSAELKNPFAPLADKKQWKAIAGMDPSDQGAFLTNAICKQRGICPERYGNFYMAVGPDDRSDPKCPIKEIRAFPLLFLLPICADFEEITVIRRNGKSAIIVLSEWGFDVPLGYAFAVREPHAELETFFGAYQELLASTMPMFTAWRKGLLQ